MRFPTFVRYRTPQDSVPHWRVSGVASASSAPESKVRTAVKWGMTPLAAYEKFGAF